MENFNFSTIITIFGTLVATVVGCLTIIKHFTRTIDVKKREIERNIKEFNEVLASPQFVNWRNEILKIYYSKNFITSVFNRDYLAYEFKCIDEYSYPY